MSPSSPEPVAPTARGELHPALKAVLGGLVALVLFGVLEVGLRLLGVPDPGLYAGDPAWAWTLRAGLDVDVPLPEEGTSFRVKTNALGLRGEAPPETGPWTLALGCSTTFGWGVEAQEAWPAQLAERLDEPVLNGGIPGWSTAQALRAVRPYLELGPSRVVLAYLVRDAWPAARTDAQGRPTPWFLRLNLARLLRGLKTPGAVSQGPLDASPVGQASAPTFRVPPEAYGPSIQALIEAAAPAEVVLLAFPQPVPTERLEPWLTELRALDAPLLAPELPRDAFFPHDPVHLNAEGHAQLATELAEWLKAEGS